MRTSRALASTVLVLALAACATDSSTTGGSATTSSTTASPAGAAGGTTSGSAGTSAAGALSPEATAFLEAHGLGGMTTEQVIERLDRGTDDRESGPWASVRPTETLLSDPASGEKVSLPMPSERFYLAMAPYESQTHECFNHHTGSCQGELVEKTVRVTITADDKTVVDEDVTTQPNGFAALWVPRHLTGTLTVTYEGKSVTTPLSTNDDAPTCLTTPLRLA